MSGSITFFRNLITGFVGGVLVLSVSGCIFHHSADAQVKREADIELFFKKWHGTNYQYGGNNDSGIDCSALMVEAYYELFNIVLPRTTEDQSTLGKRVRKRNISAGDLVFFKTGLSSRHVGLYLKDGIFVHASRSGGVIKSSLDSGYWAKKYWKTKRVIY
jgi:cell wall-associated NlpC family hydrolase